MGNNSSTKSNRESASKFRPIHNPLPNDNLQYNSTKKRQDLLNETTKNGINSETYVSNFYKPSVPNIPTSTNSFNFSNNSAANNIPKAPNINFVSKVETAPYSSTHSNILIHPPVTNKATTPSIPTIPQDKSVFNGSFYSKNTKGYVLEDQNLATPNHFMNGSIEKNPVHSLSTPQSVEKPTIHRAPVRASIKEAKPANGTNFTNMDQLREMLDSLKVGDVNKRAVANQTKTQKPIEPKSVAKTIDYSESNLKALVRSNLRGSQKKNFKSTKKVQSKAVANPQVIIQQAVRDPDLKKNKKIGDKHIKRDAKQNDVNLSKNRQQKSSFPNQLDFENNNISQDRSLKSLVNVPTPKPEVVSSKNRRNRSQSRQPRQSLSKVDSEPILETLPNRDVTFWKNNLSKSAFVKNKLSINGLPEYAKEFLQLCEHSGLLMDDIFMFEKKFLKCLKSIYTFLDEILDNRNRNSKRELPVKFGSYAEYCSYWLPFLYMNASAEIAFNITNEPVDHYQAYFSTYEIGDIGIQITIIYWVPDLEFDEIDDDDPNVIKNFRNSLIYLSNFHMPKSYKILQAQNSSIRGRLSVCYNVNSDRESKGGKKIKSAVSRHLLDPGNNPDQIELKPAATYRGIYQKVTASLLLSDNNENRNFCRNYCGSRIYMTVLNSLSQAMKQLETLKTMENNPFFTKYFLSPESEDFKIPFSPKYDPQSGLNEKQFHAVEASSILAQKKQPRALVIQGPPGTGKSHTIVAIVRRHFQDYENAHKYIEKNPHIQSSKKKNFKVATNLNKNSVGPSVLICAPSNIALDVIAKRLLDADMDILRLGIKKKTDHEVIPSHVKHISLMKDIPKRNLFTDSKIILSTLNSCQPIYRIFREFSMIIIDEAAQCSEPEILMPMFYSPKLVVFVGDHLQLPATVISRDAERSGYSRSLFERFENIIQGENMIQLTEQYRMKPAICKVPSRLFYDDNLVSCDDNGYNPFIRVSPLLCFDVTDSLEEQSKTSTSKFNIIEKNFILLLVERIITDYYEQLNRYSHDSGIDSLPSSTSTLSSCSSVFKTLKVGEIPEIKIGIICFYKEQQRMIEQEIRLKYSRDMIDVKTVDSFQGQERDIIILSCCRSNSSQAIGFAESRNRLNVAITRAKSASIVVCNQSTFKKDPTWKSLFEEFHSNFTIFSVDSRTSPNKVDDLLFLKI